MLDGVVTDKLSGYSNIFSHEYILDQVNNFHSCYVHLHTRVYACDLCTSLYIPVLKLMSYYPLAADLCIFHGMLDVEVVAGGLYFFSALWPNNSLVWQLMLSHSSMADAVVCDKKKRSCTCTS